MHKKLWNKDFILMLQGGAFSAIGDILYSMAIGYWVYEKTGSNALMGLMSSISMFMEMLVMPFSGTIIDKCNRKVIIVGMDILRGLIMLAVGAFAFSDRLSVPMVLLAAFLASACTVFFDPAASTLMLDIIPHNDMVRGKAVQNGVRTFLNLVGKGLSGALVVFLGVPLVIVLNGISYLISAGTEMFIMVPETKIQGQSISFRGLLSDCAMAVREIIRNDFLRLFIPCALIMNLLGAGPFSLMLPLVLEKGFTVEMYGYLMSVEAAASFICVALLGIVRLESRTRYWLMSWGFLVSGVFLILTYLSVEFLMVAVLLFVGIFANVLANSVFSASLMLALPEGKRGAILGFISAASTGGCALSAVVYGLLCDRFPIHLVFVFGGALSLIPVVYVCFHRRTKEFVLTH